MKTSVKIVIKYYLEKPITKTKREREIKLSFLKQLVYLSCAHLEELNLHAPTWVLTMA